ncbi:MAG: hypothetical protein MJ204_05455 [Bacteroidales bacterium]|nr:hypothetical protein [Bacteroidales bacterium]
MKDLKIIAVALLSGCIAFSSCTKEEKYSVTVTVNDPKMGSVANVDGEYKENTELNLYATANEGYHFSMWNDMNTENPRKLIVTKDLVLIAIFAEGAGNGGNGSDVTDINDAMTLSGSMNENKTLKDLGLPIDYIIDGYFYIEGNACLTIEPGVTIAFTGTNGSIEVGENAGLKMVGTAEKPITFTGPVNNQNKGSWGYIEYHSNRSDNQMEYVILKNGGSSEDGGVLRLHLDGAVSVKNCTIDGGLGDGVSTIYDNGKNLKAFENNTIKNVNGYAMNLGTMVVNGLGKGNKFEDNGKNYILLHGDLTENEELVLNNVGIPYLFDGFWAAGRSTMTVTEGITIVFAKNSEFRIGEESVVKLEGTEAAPITICGLENKAGFWKGVLYASQEDECIFKNVIISDGNEYCLLVDNYADAVLKAENITLKNAKEYGLQVATTTKEEEVDDEWIYSRDWSKVFVGGVSGLKFESCGKGNIYDNNTLNGETEGVDNVFTAIP